MNKSYRWIGAIAILSTALLAGCDTVSDAVQSVRQDVHEVVAATGDTVSGTTNDITDALMKNGEQLKLTAQREIGTETVLRIDHAVGNIALVPGSGNTLSVKTTVWFTDKKSYRNIAEEAETSLVSTNGQLKIITNPKGNPSQDLWDWADSKFGYSRFKIDYEVEVPASITSFDITNNVGKITMDNLKGVYQVHSDVGEIAVGGAYISGESQIESNAGKLRLSISGMAEDSSLKAKTDVGSIHASFADQLSCTLETDSDIGLVSGASKGKQDINGGGPLVALSSSVGNITIE
ncbi:DUF4097 family beta strand repeat-containing protein [Paenibacillus sp.]|jgi:hypothetical protein|uniref:DUF4097 family beta strand repeat-containing protein n=1 Tax=Paenibacillus sp. TaxID=58172 RepID=UPI00282EEAF2|nr:DUF4097 family beta strand repeat-containing protein [Paenibacillus sp.]MDR0269188.1 hypothetical protein [Paenibacillus sp.]